ncbi:YehR family protein [Streptococcus sp. CSL10205-OR2]|uniref:YehR family protein n=1 Tax=Streptococcus sp. CSL10205-OR2 TaxID=2980558 RepID=UPI0021DB30AC|nr:YehR family protein [Streptococcus sp. CSL10205-OR2]MCU9533618.1 YehR family protein [Streptococcus sp. CSL10205-OR2]
MKTKKIILSVLSFFALVVLVACGSGGNQENTKSDSEEVSTKTTTIEKKDSEKSQEIGYFQSLVPGIDTQITFYYEASTDMVLKQETHTQASYKALGVTTIDEAKEALAPIFSQYEGIDGITHTVDYGDEYIIENLVLDYENLDINDASKLPGFLSDGNNNATYVSYTKSADLLKESGFEEVKDGKFKDFQPLD